jgi:molybdenum cofactor cytidylyltransferase
MISAVLLAAGESRRMGEFKQLLSFRGKTFVESCIDNLILSRVDEIIVVTGHRAADVRSAAGERAVTFAHNSEYRLGMSSSIKRGVEAASSECRALVIALVDQPHVGPEIINRLIETFDSGALIAIPTYRGSRGHPIILNSSLKDEILSMKAAEGLRKVVRSHQGDTVYVSAESSAVLEDCDYPEDYQYILNR